MHKKIIISGRLGNQLFQWAFLHSLDKIGKNNFLISLKRDPYQNDLRLQFLTNFCEHFEFTDNDLLTSLKLKVADFIKHKHERIGRKIDYVLQIFREHERNNKKNCKIILGYFQDFELFIDSMNIIVPELMAAVYFNTNQIKKEIVENLGTFQVLHIRRGDFLNKNSNFQALALNYYLRNITPDLKLVLITDDIDSSKTIINSIKPNFIFGPEDFNEIECLYLMSKAKIVIAAKSTFSFWGGVLCQSNGGCTIYPSTDTSDGRNLNYPGFLIESPEYEAK